MAQKIYIVAGEASGDAHGAGLMAAMLACEPKLTFAGLGGAAMNRIAGATESCEFTKKVDFEKSDRVFDEAFDS